MISIQKLVMFVGLVLNLSYSQKAGDPDRIIYPEERSRYAMINPLHYQHKYHHRYNQRDNYDNGNDFNKGSVERGAESYQNETSMEEIPVDFVTKLNGVSYTVNDLLLHFVDGYEDDSGFLESRFGEAEERGNVQVPKPAQCMPELQTISLRQSDDPTIMYIPGCTRIERCGGCCNHNKLECQPTEMENVNYQVIKTQFRGSSKLRFVEKIAVTVERHKKCTCGCKVKAENCTIRQEYRENECQCVCRNTDEQKKCSKEPKKLWDPESCECQCRNSSICSTGTTFDFQVCKCVLSSSMRRRYIDFPNNNTAVVPLDEN